MFYAHKRGNTNYIYIIYYVDTTHVLSNFASSWDFGIFREYWISRSRCNICCSVRAQGSHEKTSASGLHGFALDQPFINGIGPINRSEKCKRSETVGNGRRQVFT